MVMTLEEKKAKKREYDRAYNEKNKEYLKARQQEYAANNREAAVERTRLWRIANPERYAEQLNRRLAKLNLQTQEERHAHYLKYNKKRIMREVEVLPDSYLQKIHLRYSSNPLTPEQLVQKRDAVLFNRKLKSEGFEKCYSVLTKKPIKLHYAKVEGRRLKQQTKERDKKYCPRCEKFLEIALFGRRAEKPNAFKSLCADCRKEQAKEDAATLSDSYLTCLLNSNGLPPKLATPEIISVKRELVKIKRLLKESNEKHVATA